VRGKPFARAIARLVGFTEDSNALRVDIVVPRPWQVRAGQSIFLSIPELGVFSGLRGHPFMISWWTAIREA
jgi:predicted ferric reductase